MSHRDSDSKLRHSKFDRESSPKRFRRDRDRNGDRERDRDRDRNGDREKDREREKESERGREKDRVTTNGGGGGDQNPVDRDQRNLPPPPPLPRHTKQESVGAAHKNSNDHQELTKHSSQPPRSRSYHQHAEWGNTEQVGRSAGRREAAGKVFAPSKDNSERVEPGQSREQRDEKSQAKLDENLHRRDGFPERKDDSSPTIRKRPAFREKKIQGDSGDANPAVTESVKASHADQPPERNERKDERSGNPRHLDRHEKQIAEDRAPNRSEGRRDGFSSRPRYGGSGGNSNYRGRDKFNARQGYHPIKTRTEKWKHDLFQEADNEPVPKNEDDQIAKLEALLAS